MAKSFELQPYTDRKYNRYNRSKVFERPAAPKPARSTLYVHDKTGQWFEDNQPLEAPNALLELLWGKLNPQVSEEDYQTVLTKHHVPVENDPAHYQTLFVAHDADKLAITVAQRDEPDGRNGEVRIDAIHAQTKPEETDISLRNHREFIEVLGKEAPVFAGDFDYIHWRGPIHDRPDGAWESTIRVRREL